MEKKSIIHLPEVLPPWANHKLQRRPRKPRRDNHWERPGFEGAQHGDFFAEQN